MRFSLKTLPGIKQVSAGALSLLLVLFVTLATISFPEKANAQAASLAGCAQLGAQLLGGVGASLGISAVTGAVPVQNPNLPVIAASTRTSAIVESCLNGIAWSVAKMVLNGLTRSIVSWINSGFRGGPTFVTNPEAFFADVADQAFGEVLQGSGLGFLCSPYQLQIKQALALSRGLSRRSQCTLSQVIKNFDNFVYGFNPYGSYGGWTQWFSLTQSNNNIYGSYLNAQAQLDISISTAVGGQRYRLDWGRGFFSSQDQACVQRVQQQNQQLLTGNQFGPPQDPNTACPITTPGSIGENALGITLTSPLRQLELADSINEIVGALISQLTSQALQSLSGLSSPKKAYGGSSYLDQLYQEQQSDYGQVRGVTAQEINNSINRENQFISINLTVLTHASSSEDLLRAVATCYLTKANSGTLSGDQAAEARLRAAQATSTIVSSINNIKNKVRFDIQGAQGNLFGLQDILSQIDSISTTSLLNRDDLVNRFIALLPYIHTDSDITVAQSDAVTSNGILDTLDQQTGVKQAECTAFPGTP